MAQGPGPGAGVLGKNHVLGLLPALAKNHVTAGKKQKQFQQPCRFCCLQLARSQALSQPAKGPLCSEMEIET